MTTEAEIESFNIIRGMLADTVPIEDIKYKDTESYFGILYKNNSWKQICRINLDTRKKQLLIPDENKKFIRFYITNAPITVPPIVPTPPAIDVPPSTTAAMAFISQVSPVFG